ncbi:glycosyltransferase family 2 protein [Candidatus Woesearchaeota archaeon CG08_land_8_20_14_0_20_47_9]|nr:MAG: hypothetical protein AUJ69_03150 [Candidatus Woesearchaeota archaeon CG1_02_47_18]PIO03915.1 MAG: glycosyltransferase family 2 protein [Candidatus Woesearchaeota archaeon CG08_land_8_20_14_0_20_47_9]HII29700.1 glycosyltransferase family 2 protein [Candidatus Woesearchaeota archaeon]
MKVVVTIPAYNEEETIAGVVKAIQGVMKRSGYEFALLVVNDGSSDRTAELARAAGAVVVSHPRNRGLAEAFRTEMRECLRLGARVIVHTDADNQYGAKDIPRLIRKLNSGYDLVLGSRFRGKIEGMPFIKRLGNMAFSRVISNVTGQRITDAQTGFRAFTRKVAAKVPITSFHTYTQEQIIRAAQMHFRIGEVPVYFARRGGDGQSRLMRGPFEYAFKAWINLLRIYRDYAPIKFFGLFGGVFLVAGLALGVWITYLFITTGAVGGLPRVILATMLLSSGLQILLFGFLADMNRRL